MGVLLAVASRSSARVRSQLGRDVVLVVGSRDGPARSFIVRDRQVSSRAGAARGARCTLRFRSAAMGTRILLAPNAIDRIVDGLAAGDVECDGQAAYVLWFYELVMGLVPFRSAPRSTATSRPSRTCPRPPGSPSASMSFAGGIRWARSPASMASRWQS